MDEVTQRLVEKVGLRSEADGLPRTAGRITAFLLVSPDEKSLDEIASALQVSKASVSTNTRLLEQSGIIERVGRPGDRRDFYRIAPDLHTRMLQRWLEGFRAIHMLLVWSLAEGVGKDAVIRKRIETLADFFDHMLEECEGAGERWTRDHARQGAGESHLSPVP